MYEKERERIRESLPSSAEPSPKMPEPPSSTRSQLRRPFAMLSAAILDCCCCCWCEVLCYIQIGAAWLDALTAAQDTGVLLSTVGLTFTKFLAKCRLATLYLYIIYWVRGNTRKYYLLKLLSEVFRVLPRNYLYILFHIFKYSF